MKKSLIVSLVVGLCLTSGYVFANPVAPIKVGAVIFTKGKNVLHRQDLPATVITKGEVLLSTDTVDVGGALSIRCMDGKVVQSVFKNHNWHPQCRRAAKQVSPPPGHVPNPTPNPVGQPLMAGGSDQIWKDIAGYHLSSTTIYINTTSPQGGDPHGDYGNGIGFFDSSTSPFDDVVWHVTAVDPMPPLWGDELWHDLEESGLDNTTKAQIQTDYYLQFGFQSEAIKEIKLFKLQNYDPQYGVYLGDLEVKAGDLLGAEQAYYSAANLAGDWNDDFIQAAAFNSQAGLYFGMGKNDAGLSAFTKAHGIYDKHKFVVPDLKFVDFGHSVP